MATTATDNGTTLGRLDFVSTSLTSRRSKSTCSHLKLSNSSSRIPVATAASMIGLRCGPDASKRRRYSSCERKRVRGIASGRERLSKRARGFWVNQPDLSAKESKEDKVARYRRMVAG